MKGLFPLVPTTRRRIIDFLSRQAEPLMRVLLDFISGIANGIRGGEARPSYTNTNPVKVRPAQRIRPSTLDLFGRFFVLIIGVGLIAMAIKASSAAPRKTPAAEIQQSLPELIPTFTSEVIATDEAVSSRDWKYIVIHHSATQRGSAHSFDQYHRFQRKWPGGLGYHFVVGNGTDQGDGAIVAGPRWKIQEPGAHANSAEYNEKGIGICLVGNFDENPPSPAQLGALRSLILKLCGEYNIPTTQVVGHNDIRRGGSTACPGKYFSIPHFRESL